MKSLPARPSLASLRKQAKKLARDRSLSLRDAQLLVAREYGFDGWKDLTAEVEKRLGKGLEWAVAQARHAIHDNDVDRLQRLVAEYPALLSWRGPNDHESLLGFATGAYGDAGTPEREQWFTRAAPAELLIDAGAVVLPEVPEGILQSHARGLLQLLHGKGLLPRTLRYFAALGDLEGVRTLLEERANSETGINEAFLTACSFRQEGAAAALLERLIALDSDLTSLVDETGGRDAFIRYVMDDKFPPPTPGRPWSRVFLMRQIDRALHNDDLNAFVAGLERAPWLLREDFVDVQNDLISTAALQGRGPFISALLDRNPAILRRPPQSQAIEFAMTYGHAQLIPLLTRVWPLPDDLPHAAGVGDLAGVKRWFDASGAPALGTPEKHDPWIVPGPRRDLGWDPISVQHVLDVALAYAVINRHFDVADFLLEHGADVNTNWNSHEPASILHHVVFLPDNYERMQFLIDRGIDLAIKDYRWDATAIGWARHGKGDEAMARWLEEAERRRGLVQYPQR